MPDISADRQVLARLRQEVAVAEQAVAETRARAIRARDTHTKLLRQLNPRDRGDAERLRQHAAELQGANRDAAATAADAQRARDDLFERLKDFGSRHDPRVLLPELDDGTPLLLFPLRLETRFIRSDGSNELWVRVFPDVCLVESFDPLLSASEFSAGRLFWQRWWRAGQHEPDQQAAWRDLTGASGVPRATWVVRTLRPLNEQDAPIKSVAHETILVIASDALPAQTERPVISRFWVSRWRTPEDAGSAQGVLEATLGVSRAQAVMEAAPFNLADNPPAPHTRDTAPVRVVFLQLPDNTLTTDRSWSSAPVVRTLPERLVLRAERASEAPLEVVGNVIPVPLTVGPDPEGEEGDQLSQVNGVLQVPEVIRWMVDFDTAVNMGMGFRVPLTPAQATTGFDRLLVLGVRLTSDVNEGADTLATLISHHRYGASGFALVPQGTPTNNTESAPSGYDRRDDPAASYNATFQESTSPPSASWDDRTDGQWFSALLGLPNATVAGVPYAAGRDQEVARAMGTALWPATMGYMLETMLHPIFSEATVDAVRWFHNRLVSGRGWLPAVRVGNQPYGILPTSAMRRWRWVTDTTPLPPGAAGAPVSASRVVAHLLRTLQQLERTWDELSQGVAAVGRPGDPHQALLDILGLHPTSAEYYQRYAQSLEAIRARARLFGADRRTTSVIDSGSSQNEARQLLRQLGYAGATDPDVLSRIFHGAQQPLSGPLVDDRPLSETDPVRSYTDDGRNYLQWLVESARASVDAVRAETGFAGNEPPTALLYLMLRHALTLGYWDTSVRLHGTAGVLNEAARAATRREAPFVHVAAQTASSESRWAMLYGESTPVTGIQDRVVSDHITSILGTEPTRLLDEQLTAIDRLTQLPTSQLERAFVEHLDCASYRLDAWVQGMIQLQLATMRERRSPEGEPQARTGIHLGAFGWLEDVRPRASVRNDVRVTPDLSDFFTPPGAAPLTRDETNGGYMMTPSLNHATTAAVLRSGYLANASAANPASLAVNLSSNRIRVAQQILEGIRNGQSLGALLGYRLERGLHDRHPMAEVDRFIGALRLHFPLRANRLEETVAPPGTSIEAIEARNVVDGELLVAHIRQTGTAGYPFGLDLPPANTAQATAIDAAVDALLDAHDAIADLALAESVHQATQGNFDRAAATLDAFGRGGLPPEPDVVRTPTGGTIMTHRVALHLAADANPTVSPVPGVAMTPRAACEPAVNAWLAGQLPTADKIYCRVHVTSAVAGTTATHEVTQQQLGLQPIDLLSCIVDTTDPGMSELEDRIVRHALVAFAQRPDDVTTIQFTELHPDRSRVSFFELTPLLRALRTLVSGARPLRATDLALPGEATTRDDDDVRMEPGRVVLALGALEATRAAIVSAGSTLSAATIEGFDDAVTVAADAVAPLAFFGVRAAMGEWYAWRRTTAARLVERVRTRTDRWTRRRSEALQRLQSFDVLPPGPPTEEQFAELESIQRLIAAQAIVPRPTSVTVCRQQTGDALSAFVARRDALLAAIEAPVSSYSALRAGVVTLLPVDAFDVEPFSLDELDDEVVRHLGELGATLATLRDEVDHRLAEASRLLTAAEGAANAAKRVDLLRSAAKAIFGQDFSVIPAFDLAGPSRVELSSALAHSASGALLQFQREQRANRAPVDTWLYGVARVREAMRAWEQVAVFSDAFDAGASTLTPLQLPSHPAAPWLALEFPPDLTLDGDHVCYTAHFAQPFDPARAQCGLLIDEWSEVIPVKEHTAGIAFHFDRPNAEPPQVWLLATPSGFGEGWSWDDVVGSVTEAFERARRRAVEPSHLDATTFARLLPGVIAATASSPVAIAVDFAANNGLTQALAESDDG